MFTGSRGPFCRAGASSPAFPPFAGVGVRVSGPSVGTTRRGSGGPCLTGSATGVLERSAGADDGSPDLHVFAVTYARQAMSAIESRTTSSPATSQIVTCSVVLTEMAPIAASACEMTAKSTTEIETIFVTLEVDAEASPSSFLPENRENQLLSMVSPTFRLSSATISLIISARPVLEEIALEL